MDKTLWKEIEKFDFDFPLSEYGFSTRLAFENEWTTFFTQKAIEEYKKFMYLAVTSNQMVSPSEIVDIVWHQHLIFTQSYKEFGDILGKKIEHIPSTHNREEIDKFLAAKKRTKELYESVFGNQPKEFWENNTFVEALEIEKSKRDTTFYSSLSIPLVLIFVLLFRLFLYDLYVSIDNPYFVLFFILVSVAAFLGLHFYNTDKLYRKLSDTPNIILKNLTPSELIYIESGQLKMIIHGYVNYLVVNKNLKVDTKDNIKLINADIDNLNPIFKSVLDCFKGKQTISYKELLETLIHKPIINKASKAASSITKTFVNSKIVLDLYKVNLIVLSSIMVFGLTRVFIGFIRGKEIIYIVILNAIFLFFALYFLRSFSKKAINKIIVNYFKERVIPLNKSNYNNWEWNYFIIGTALLSVSFMPIVQTYSGNNNNFGCGSGCSSCGSSCGGGCGGCGGCGS